MKGFEGFILIFGRRGFRGLEEIKNPPERV
jgi:hypothetical protein